MPRQATATARRKSPRRVRELAPQRKNNKKKRRISFKNIFCFIAILIIVFFSAFFYSGGTEITGAHTVENITHVVTTTGAEKLERALEAENNNIAQQDDEENVTPSTAERIGRLIFLRSAVDKKIKKMNGYTTIDKIPESLQEAVVSIEDNRFYEHYGFDLTGIARASLVNLQYGEVKEGASTITQQLVKNMFLSQEQSFGRKAEELLLAIDIEMHYSKQEILEMYLNSIYFGSGYYGINEAADGYFGKLPNKLNLAESSMLAGVPNAPSLYSPYVDFILAKKRQIIVLDAMVKNGYVKSDIAEDAKIKPLILAH